jgi:hypothetical protein
VWYRPSHESATNAPINVSEDATPEHAFSFSAPVDFDWGHRECRGRSKVIGREESK